MEGDHILVGRIPMFMGLFGTGLAARHSYQSLAEVGLVPPDGPWKRELTELAIFSLRTLDPTIVLQNTSAGRVNVAQGLMMPQGFLEELC